MATVDFLPFANDATSANVVTQAVYVAAQGPGLWGDTGFTAGIALSEQLNKVWRQSSVMTAALAQAISQTLSVDVLDSGGAASVTALTNQIVATMAAASSYAAPPLTPQGRLTLATGTPVMSADVLGSTVVYYTPYIGNQIPIWNGSQYVNYTFAPDLTLSLTAAAAANSIVDVFATVSGAAAVLGFGPVWGTSTPGSCSRGTGAGTTQLGRTQGLWGNANVITLYNGATTYSAIPAHRATYLGSVYVDGTSGQTSYAASFGQNRKCGVWNAYNRKAMHFQAGDSTTSWGSASGPRAWNADANNVVSAFCGLPEEAFLAQTMNRTTGSTSHIGRFGVGWNSTSAFSGFIAQHTTGSTYDNQYAYATSNAFPPALGINNIQGLEDSTMTVLGGSDDILLLVSYMG
jgi:hypothetical protein